MPVRLKIEIEVDDKGIVKFKDLEGHADDLNKRLKSLTDTARLTKIVFSGLVGIFATKKLYNFTQDVIKLNAEFDRAERLFMQASYNVGRFTAATHESHMALAQYYQDLTSYHRTAIIDGMKILITFEQISNKILPRATEAMINYASFTGVSMFSAAKAIGKASHGLLGDLKRVGVQVNEATYQLKGFIGILEELESQMTGQAEMMGRAYMGRWRQLANAIKDFKIELGAVINEILIHGGILEKFTDRIKELRDFFKDLNRMQIEKWIKVISLSILDLVKTFTAVSFSIMELFKITAQSIYERWENLLSRVEKFLDRIDDIQREVQRKSKEAWNAFSLNFIWESGFFENLANFFGFEKYNPPGAGYVEYGAPYPMTQEEAARGEAWNKINKFWEKQDARADKIYAKIEEIIKLFSISPIIWARDLQIMQKSFGEFAIGKGIGMGFPGTQLLTSTEILAGFGGLRKALQDPLPAEKVSELWENAIKNIEADFAKGWAKFMAGAEIDFDQLIEGMLLHLSTALITDIWKKPMLGGRLPGKWGDWLTIGGGAYGAYQAGGWEQGAITGGVTGLSSGGGIWGAVIGAIAGGMLGEMGKKERRGSSPLILAYEEAMQEIEQATTNAISNAFIASLETGEFFTFTQELKKGLYENIVIAFTDAFARGGLIGQGIGQVMENIIKRIQYTITEEEARIMAMQVAPYPGKMRDELTKIFLQQHLREGLPTAEEAQEIALYATEQMEKLGETMEAMRPVWEAVEKGLKDLNVTMGLSLETQLEEIEINKAYIDSVQDYIRTLRFGGNMPFDIVSLQAEFGRLAGGAGTMEGLSTFLGFLQGQYMPIMQSYAMDYPAIVEQVISFLENLEEIKKTEIEDILNDIYDALGTKGAIVDQLKELGLEIGTHFDAFDIKYPAELIAPKIPAPVINLTVKIEDGQVTAEVDEGTVITEPSPTPAPPLTPNINAIYSVGNYQYQYGYLVGSFGRVSSPRVAQAKRQFQQEGWGSIPWPH